MEVARIWFDFKGRMNRGKFWLVMVANTLVIAAAILVTVIADSLALSVLASSIILVLIISAIAAGIKRLHDRNKSAWWLLLFYVVPSILQAFANRSPDVGLVFGLIGFAVSIWALVELGCMRGSIGGNPHGSDPVAPRPAQH